MRRIRAARRRARPRRCTGGDGKPADGPARASGTRGDPGPAPTSALDADPAKAPRDEAAARTLIDEVIAEPALFGPEAVAATPYESDPGRWSVLGDDCIWRREPLPGDVLATLSRHFEVPPAAGKGAARLVAVVTVHHTPSDPARIGGHRLLARLGAGGMGVVYLGRAETGELAAVKVIRPEYAAETDFRARFRREAAAARRVRSPWVVPVTGADPEAEAPWLATAFVPGPALDDAGVPEPAANTMDTLCVTRAPEELLAAPFLRYLTDDRPVRRTAVVRDEGREAADFSLALGENPPNDGIVTVHDTDDGIAAAVEAAVARDAEAVIYAGVSPERAAQCARAMAAADFAGPRGGTWRTMTPAFLKAAGITAGGWLCAAPFSDPAAPRDFAAAYRAAYGAAPPRWAPEAYDAVGLVAAAIARQKRTATDGTVDRGALAQELFRETYRGVAKELTFARDDTHQLEPGGSLFLYQARGDTFASLGPYA